MSGKDPLAGSLNENANVPQVGSGIPKSRKGASVGTNLRPIKWTKKKLFFTSFGLGFPFVVAVVATLVAGAYLITMTLVSVALMVLLLSQLTRLIDRDEF